MPLPDFQGAADELMEQRDAVLFGTWVNTKPVNPGEACLTQRVVYKNPHAKQPFARKHLGLGAGLRFVMRALEPHRDARWPWRWNDRKCRTREEVIDVLDEAIRLAKEFDSQLAGPKEETP